MIDIFIETSVEVTDAETERLESSMVARSASVACGFWERDDKPLQGQYPRTKETGTNENIRHKELEETSI
jgi:hypothetical protein